MGMKDRMMEKAVGGMTKKVQSEVGAIMASIHAYLEIQAREQIRIRLNTEDKNFVKLSEQDKNELIEKEIDDYQKKVR